MTAEEGLVMALVRANRELNNIVEYCGSRIRLLESLLAAEKANSRVLLEKLVVAQKEQKRRTSL